MLYREFQPRSETRSFLRCLWTLQTDEIAVQRIVPDGCPELIVNLGRPFEAFREGEWNLQPRVFLVGQITGPLLVRPSGPAQILAARFHPHGAGRVFQFPMDSITDSVHAVEFRAETVEELEAALLAKVTGSDAVVDEAVRRLIENAPDLASLAADLKVSARQLERRFKNQVGISPKLFSQMQRFQRVFREIESGGNWVEAALACGYYDQAHLVRDMRRFSGETPSALLKGDELARHFLSHFSKTASPKAP